MARRVIWRVCLAVVGMAFGATMGRAKEAAGGAALQNPGFEEWVESTSGPALAGWRYYTSAKLNLRKETNFIFSGNACARLVFQGAGGAVQGVVQRVPVIPGRAYTFCVQRRSAPDTPVRGSGEVQLGIEWRNAAMDELSRIFTPGSGGPLSRLRWDKTCLIQVRAPQAAVVADIGIHVLDGKKGGQGAILIDEVLWMED